MPFAAHGAEALARGAEIRLAGACHRVFGQFGQPGLPLLDVARRGFGRLGGEPCAFGRVGLRLGLAPADFVRTQRGFFGRHDRGRAGVAVRRRGFHYRLDH